MIYFPYIIVLQSSTAQNAVFFVLALLVQSILVVTGLGLFSVVLWVLLFWECRRKRPLAFRFLENGQFFYALSCNPNGELIWVRAHIQQLRFWHAKWVAFSVENEFHQTQHFCIDDSQCSPSDFRRLKMFVRYFLWEKSALSSECAESSTLGGKKF